MRKTLRVISVTVALAVFFVMLFSSLFILGEADHECIGEDCPICIQIAVCENVVRSAAVLLCASGVCLITVAGEGLFVRIRRLFCRALTPVVLKIKLSD